MTLQLCHPFGRGLQLINCSVTDSDNSFVLGVVSGFFWGHSESWNHTSQDMKMTQVGWVWKLWSLEKHSFSANEYVTYLHFPIQKILANMATEHLICASVTEELNLKCLILFNLNLCCSVCLVASILNSLVLDILSTLWMFIHFSMNDNLPLTLTIHSLHSFYEQNTVNAPKCILEVYQLEHCSNILATS